MTLSITHAKTNNIADPTQADVNAQIALGNLPSGTVLADLTLHSDWNAAHTLTGQVSTAQVESNAITNAKIAAMAANTLKANATASPADPTDFGVTLSSIVGRGATGNLANLSLGPGLGFSGSTIYNTAPFTGASGSDTQVQFSDKGALSGAGNLLYGTPAGKVNVGPNGAFVGALTIENLNGAANLYMRGNESDPITRWASSDDTIRGDIDGVYYGINVLGDNSGYGLGLENSGTSLTVMGTSGYVKPGAVFFGALDGSPIVDFRTSNGTSFLLIEPATGVTITSDITTYGNLTSIGNAQYANVASSGVANFNNISANLVEINPSASPPGSNGDIVCSSTQQALLTYQAGLVQALVGTIFTQTADKTVTNTVTETSILGTGVGTKTLPANFFVSGKTIRLRIGGIYTTPLAATPSVTIKVKYGSTVIASVATTSLLSGATNLEFDGEIDITCRTAGSSGTVMAHGDIEYATGVAGTIAVNPLNNAGAATTINTTTSNALDVTITWDSATSTRSATSTVTTIEVLN